MKRKKLLSWAVAAALCLSASVLPAAAASFPDVVDHWAVKYIDDVVAKNIFVGIDGKFVPDQDISYSEVLAVCARIAVDKETRNEIGAARADQIKGLMGTTQDYFHKEYAVCLEAGILSYSELKELYQSGDLPNLKPITKEKFTLYLTRAMQLESLAKNLPSYSLDFTDKKDITPSLEPYIYVLNMYGVVTGTDAKKFEPKSAVNRAVASTMLSRATDFMEENGTSTELSEYTDYDWVSGTILSASASDKGVIILSLASDVSGTRNISIPAETAIYQNSMLVKSTQLKAGTYARVNLDSSGAPIEVRLSGTVQTYTGSVVGIDESAVMLSVGGVTSTMSYDRFTEVQVGSATGDRGLVDLDAGYTTATCRVDQLGHMVALQLTGGTHKQEGIVSNVENIATGGVTMTISGFDGQLQKVTVPTSAVVTSNGLALANGALSSSYKGSYVSLRVSNDNASNVVSASLDTITKYIQGAVKATSVDNGVNTVTITDLATSKATTYKVADKATFAYNDTSITYGGIQKDSFVTVRIAGGDLSALWAYPGSSVTEGTISGISFPNGTTQEVIAVTKSDGSISSFEFNLAGALPEVKRSGKASSLDKLRSGDVVKVTVRYNTVTLIEATPQSANLTGTISELSQTTSGITIKVDLDNNGGTQTYVVSSDVSVTQGGKTIISMYDLRVGHHVAMVASGDQVVSIDVDKTAVSSNELSGSVIMVNRDDKTILFRVPQSGGADKIVTVSVPSGTTIQDVTGGARTSLSKISTGDTLTIYGSYTNELFKATLVVCK